MYSGNSARKSADKYSGFSRTAGISACDKKDEGYIHGLGTVSLLNEKSRIEAENEKICAFIDAIPVETISQGAEAVLHRLWI